MKEKCDVCGSQLQDSWHCSECSFTNELFTRNRGPEVEAYRGWVKTARERWQEQERLKAELEALNAGALAHDPAGPEKGKNWVIPDLGLELIWCDPGKFQFGGDRYLGLNSSLDGIDWCFHKKRSFRITSGFWMGRYLVTQEEYNRITNETPSYFKGDRKPVDSVTWEDALNFCAKLNMRSNRILPSEYRFSLPTEAQWEYACRAGTHTRYCFGNDVCELPSYGWYGNDFLTMVNGETHKVGELLPNAWGFFDMHGNVYEWCYDWYSEISEQPMGEMTDWRGPRSADFKVIRGGSKGSKPEDCLSAHRGKQDPLKKWNHLGFRLALLESVIE